ncbi:MAG: DUF6152 family protein [Acetobacteraceae bacterium]
MQDLRLRTARLAVAALLVFAEPAAAHHGWSWTEDQESRLSGTIVSISLGNPHAHMTLRNDQGVWEVDLAPPGPTRRAGFVDGVAAAGDTVSVTGHRSRNPGEHSFKAETVTVHGKTYDVYPSRPKTLKPGP